MRHTSAALRLSGTLILTATLLSACAVSIGSGSRTAGSGATATAQRPVGDGGVTVFLVRHAEKATEPATDPALTSAGQARAAALAVALRDGRLDAVFTTQLRRTQDTARPTASAAGLALRVVANAGEARAHAAAVADSVRSLPAGSTALVVGHSNTIPAIVTALGGPPLADLCDAEYDAIYVVALRPGKTSTVAKARYGAPSELTGCGAMK